MLKNVFQIPKKDSTNHIIIRQTRFVLYSIFFIIFLYIAVLLWIFIWYISFDITRLWEWFSGYILLWNVILIMILWMILITWLVKYFYSIVIVTADRIIYINYWLLFRESIRIINLQKNLSITSSQKWIIQTLCNYWKIIMRNANEAKLILEKIPKPKYVAKKIDELCKNK